jgi:hypothetical protein
MELACLVLTPSEDPNLTIFLQYPKSLKELTYKNIRLKVALYSKYRSLLVLNDTKTVSRGTEIAIMPQVLPNLKVLNVYESDLTTRRMGEFLALNPDVKVVDYHLNR